MKILLTGASSYVGARLFFDLSKQFDVIGTYHGNQLSKAFIPLDITNNKDVSYTFKKQKPSIIIHVAGNPNPRSCATNPKAAILLNQTATNYIVKHANAINAKIIFISSFAAINPKDLYGKTKEASENFVKETVSGWSILRPSVIIGFSPNTTNDRSFNRILKNLNDHTPAIYDTSWKFQPTYVGHISEIITAIIQRNLWKTTIPIVSEELKSRFDIAKDILSPFNIPVTPIDAHDTMQTITDDLSTLKKLKLPTYSYKTIIEKIIKEIRHRDILLS